MHAVFCDVFLAKTLGSQLTNKILIHGHSTRTGYSTPLTATTLAAPSATIGANFITLRCHP